MLSFLIEIIPDRYNFLLERKNFMLSLLALSKVMTQTNDDVNRLFFISHLLKIFSQCT